MEKDKGDLGLWVNIFGLAMAAILVALWGGTPYDHPDFVTGHLGRVLSNEGNPRFFNYPGLVIYLVAAAYGAAYLILKASNVIQSPAELKELVDGGSLLQVPFSVPAYLPGQLVIAFFCVLGVLASYGIVYRLTQNRSASLFAGLVLLFSPLWAINSHMLTVDIPTAALVVATIYLYLGAVRHQQSTSWHYLAVGLVAGLATAAKYPSGLLVAVLIIAELFNTKHKLQLRIQYGLLIGVSSLVAFFAFNPYIILDFATFWEDFSFELAHSKIGHHGFSSAGILFHLRSSLPTGIGLPFLILAIIGYAILLLQKNYSWNVRIALLLFPLLHLLIVCRSALGFQRYVLPLAPFVAIGAGFFLFILISHQRMFRYRVTVSILAVLLLYLNSQDTWKSLRLLAGRDTRLVLKTLILEKSKQEVFTSNYAKRVMYPDEKMPETPGQRSIAVLDSFDLDRHLKDTCMLPSRYSEEVCAYDSVLHITPYRVSKTIAPYSPESVYAPAQPDLPFRTMAGPYIEIYFNTGSLSHEKLNGIQQLPFVRINNSKDGYYCSQLARLDCKKRVKNVPRTVRN